MTKSAACCASQAACFDALKGRVDDPVEVAELRIIGQEFGDLQQLGGARERPGFGISRIFELFRLDAEMGRRYCVVGVEIGVRSVAEDADRQLRVLHTSGDSI